MGKIRRRNYVFLTWAGDHSPRHVHVYRSGKLVLKWDLENEISMKGKAPQKQYWSLFANFKKKAYYEDS